jgi:hypothetical protein
MKKQIITPNKFWVVSERANGQAFSVSQILDRKGGTSIHHICHMVDGSPHSEPNAYLISTAPRMLELLEKIRDQGICHGVSINSEIEELITQARRGES